MFSRFQCGCRLWQAYVEAFLRETVSRDSVGTPTYEFFPPTLSADQLTATLPIGGTSTLGSRSKFENIASYLLREFLPHEFRSGLDEGLTEPDPHHPEATATNWRSPGEPIERVLAAAMPFGSPTRGDV
jgi:hypothetical protein